MKFRRRLICAAIIKAIILTAAPAVAQPFTLLSPTPGGIVDPHSWNVSHTPLSGDFSLLSRSGNEFGLNIQTRIAGPTNSSIPYERAAIIGEISTSDPSSGNATHDAVGITGMGRINGDNPSGRAWGLYGVAANVPGGDGLLIGGELDVVNRGSDQPLNATSTTKDGLFIAGFGEYPLTTAIDLESAHAHTGIFAPNDVTVPPDAQLIDSSLKVRWSDGAIAVNNPAAGYRENSINVKGAYYMNGVRADLPVYDSTGQPWAPNGAFLIVSNNQVFLCNETTCLPLTN